MNIELRNELYLSTSWPYSTGQQGHGPLIPFIIFQCSIITSKKSWIVILLLVNCYNNDSSWNKATDLHLTVVCRRGSIWHLEVKTRRWTWLFYTFATAQRNKNVLVCNFCFSNSAYNKANIFLGLIEYELNSLLGASHLVDYISVHIRFDLERYLLNNTNKAYWKTKDTLSDFDVILLKLCKTAGCKFSWNQQVFFKNLKS